MIETYLFGLGSACWEASMDIGTKIIGVIALTCLFCLFIYGIRYNIQEWNKLTPEERAIKRLKAKQDSNWKKDLIGFGLFVLITLGVGLYFWLIGMILKMKGLCG